MVVLFGDIRFDGRVKRMIEVARQLGEVCLVSTSLGGKDDYQGMDHVVVALQPKWSTAHRHLAFWHTVIRQAHRWKPNVVFAEDYFTTMPGWLAAKAAKAHLVYDAHEIIIPYPGQGMSLRDRVWYAFERFVVQRASLVVAANPERAALMAEHYRLRHPPTYMRNIPTRRVMTDEARDRVLSLYPALARRSKCDRIVIYQGDMSLERGLARFVAALDYLPDCYRLVVVGGGPDARQLTQLASKHATSGRFAALGRIPNDDLIAVAALADVGIVTYSYDGLNNIYCAPNKVFEYAQAGIPIVSTDQPPIRAIIRDFPFGRLLEEGATVQRVAQEIETVAQGTAALKALHAPFLAAYAPELEHLRVIDAIGERIGPINA
ncbi:glycosyltransferase [Devosia sp. Root105]|uniref:glycosyltransferase n=1 Tax=Devosia sp. Root105 TaxID=1736423 RepID=UPI0012E334C0|nr:glycosyltransferase [Devosia sp. Root105]